MLRLLLLVAIWPLVGCELGQQMPVNRQKDCQMYDWPAVDIYRCETAGEVCFYGSHGLSCYPKSGRK